MARIPERIRWKAVTRGSQEKSPGQKRRELYAKRHEQVLEKRSLGKSTSELLEKAQGKGQLATETLKEMMLKLLPLAQNHYPLDKNGNWRKRRNPGLGETESVGTFLKLIKAAARLAYRLAPYQSPKARGTNRTS